MILTGCKFGLFRVFVLFFACETLFAETACLSQIAQLLAIFLPPWILKSGQKYNIMRTFWQGFFSTAVWLLSACC
jgi:uncharacterized membrane protein YjgN (DUF898 family)